MQSSGEVRALFPDTEEWPSYYWGRKWDAPFTDDSTLLTKEQLEAFLPHTCSFCQEPLTAEDDIVLTPGIQAHLECEVRSGVGDVQHLEGRCLCYRGQGNEIDKDSDYHETYRESSKAALNWLLDNKQGRFHD